MSVTNEIIQDNPDKYEILLESKILDKQFEMKLNQYNALQNQYYTLLNYNNNNRTQPSVPVNTPCLDNYDGCPQWNSCCPGGSGSNSSVTCGSPDWMKENCKKTCNTCVNVDKPIQPSGYWTDIPNNNYQSNMVGNPTESNSNWKFLGKTNNLTDCKLKAVEEKDTAFASVVYYPSDFGNNWSKSCFGGVKGGDINPQKQSKTITSLAPNGTTILGGEEGARLVKEMNKLQDEIIKLAAKVRENGIGLDKTKQLYNNELSIQNDKLEILLTKLHNDRNELNRLMTKPVETAKEENSRIRQTSSYTYYIIWILLVVISLYVAYHIYSREMYDISVYVYLFIAFLVILLIINYYNDSKEYGIQSWNYISSLVPNIHI